MRQFFHHFTEQNKFYFTERFEQIRVVWLGGLRVLDLQSEGLESTGLFTGFLQVQSSTPLPCLLSAMFCYWPVGIAIHVT